MRCSIQVISFLSHYDISMLLPKSHHISIKVILNQAAVGFSHSQLTSVHIKLGSVMVPYFPPICVLGNNICTPSIWSLFFTSTLLYNKVCNNKQPSVDSFLVCERHLRVFISTLLTIASDSIRMSFVKAYKS